MKPTQTHTHTHVHIFMHVVIPKIPLSYSALYVRSLVSYIDVAHGREPGPKWDVLPSLRQWNLSGVIKVCQQHVHIDTTQPTVVWNTLLSQQVPFKLSELVVTALWRKLPVVPSTVSDSLVSRVPAMWDTRRSQPCLQKVFLSSGIRGYDTPTMGGACVFKCLVRTVTVVHGSPPHVISNHHPRMPGMVSGVCTLVNLL